MCGALTFAATPPPLRRTNQHRRTRRINTQRHSHHSNTRCRRIKDANGIPLQPDLILAGQGEGKRIWVDAKSHAYTSSYSDATRKWNPIESRKNSKKVSLHRQFYLDRFASAQTLDTEFWANAKLTKLGGAETGEAALPYRPATIKWWYQVWDDQEKREYHPPRNKGDTTKPTPIPVPLHTSWLKPSELVKLTPRFEALQKYLTSLPDTHVDVIQLTLGMKDIHAENNTYQGQQVGKNNRDIAPFTLPFALAQVAGSTAKEKAIDAMMAKLVPEKYRKWITKENLTEEDIKAMRAELEKEVDRVFGVFADAVNAADRFTPEWWKRIEDKAGDYIDGAVGDDLLEKLGNIELPEGLGFCTGEE